MSRVLVLSLVAAAALAVPFSSAARGASGPLVANGRIAFAAVGGLASMNPDGSGQWSVNLDVGDTQPAWSPDGTTLAAVSHWANKIGIIVQQPDGTNNWMLTTDPNDRYPSWSPDGRRSPSRMARSSCA
jgi:Periplasmic component of the Tol biopolymer transport system